MPIGHVDTPDVLHEVGPEGVQFTGWALGFEEFEGVGVELVEDESGKATPLGEVTFHTGTRPDVAATYHRFPNPGQAGWSFELTPMAPRALPSRPVELRFRARNKDGSSTILGRRRVQYTDGPG